MNMALSEKQSRIDDLYKQGLALPFTKNLGVYIEPLSLYGKIIHNRIGIQPLEGFDSDISGVVIEKTLFPFLRKSNNPCL